MNRQLTATDRLRWSLGQVELPHLSAEELLLLWVLADDYEVEDGWAERCADTLVRFTMMTEPSLAFALKTLESQNIVLLRDYLAPDDAVLPGCIGFRLPSLETTR